jgi:hypothetical protein
MGKREGNELLSFSGGGRANSMVSTDRTKSGLFVAYLTDFMIHTALVRVCVCVCACVWQRHVRRKCCVHS